MDADIRRLHEMNDKRLPIKEMALLLGRTPATTSQMLTKHGLHKGASTCRYCEAPLTHPAVGRKKQYCDQLCTSTHLSELGYLERREAYGVRHCKHCGDLMTPFKQKYCGRVCSQAAWHQSVMTDPTKKARRYAMLRADRLRRAGAT